MYSSPTSRWSRKSSPQCTGRLWEADRYPRSLFSQSYPSSVLQPLLLYADVLRKAFRAAFFLSTLSHSATCFPLKVYCTPRAQTTGMCNILGLFPPPDLQDAPCLLSFLFHYDSQPLWPPILLLLSDCQALSASWFSSQSIFPHLNNSLKKSSTEDTHPKIQFNSTGVGACFLCHQGRRLPHNNS